ncbi:hypothetical protein [Pseudomonas veronii]
MDRQIVYPGQILPETALLQMAKDAMIGSAKLAAAMLGTSTIANGFAVTPTGPASLQIVVAPGEIYAMANIDSLAFSTLPADTTHSILKQGIMLDGVTLSCPAPTTTGQSINYLVQVTYQDQDSTPVLLPYYNSANPALPYSGMGNNGLTQNTSRKGVAIVQVKAGASAATGSQVTPAPDSGYVGLFVATVAYGQTTITSGNITQYAGAPLLPSGVLQSIQGGNTTYALDTGAVNACAATFFPAITSLVDGLTLRFKAANSNTGAATFSPNGISAAPIVGGNHAALQGGEIAATGDVWVQWNSSIGGGSWVLVESSGGGLQVASGTKSQHAISAEQAQAQGVTAFSSGGVSTALTLTPVPAITAYAANQRFRVKFGLVSTGADTINVSGRGAKSIKQYDATGAKIPAVFFVGQLADVEYDGTDFVLLNPVVSINKTTSPIDTTAGLVTVTGDAGWLADGTPAAALVANADTWTASGSWRTGPTWTGSPYAGSQGRNQGTLLHQCGFSDATYASQLFLGISSDNLWFRRKTANVWAAPVELWHTGNLAAKAQCTAWVNFNGSGTVTTRGSYNVSSITDNGTGDYTINFATAMANANYVPAISVQSPVSGAVTRTGVIYATSSTSANGLGTTAARILVGNTSGTTNLEDNATVAFSVIGGV